MSFGAYATAWISLHKLRSMLVRFDSVPLGHLVEMDETSVGGKGCSEKKCMPVATEKDGRVRRAHAEINDAEAAGVSPTARLRPRPMS